jgi:hypothetical protein
MTEPLTGDLNTVIATAVNARVEAAVVAALSGDDVIGRYVTAALQQEIEVEDRSTYRKVKMTFLNKVLMDAIRNTARTAVGVALEEEKEQIHKLVRAAVKRNLGAMTDKMTDKLLEQAGSQYGLTVDLKWRD